MSFITLAQANAVIAAATAKGAELGLKPLTIAVVDAEGRIIGAVGVSGDTSDNDEIAALAGIAAAGLKAQG